MLTYQARPRVIHVVGPERPQFPATVVINFLYQPEQSFGMSAEGGTAILRASTPSISLDMNTGRSSVTMNPPLAPLSVEIDDPHCLVSLKGNQLTVSRQCESLDAVVFLIEAIYFGLKMLLAVDFSDPPIVERVEGSIGSVPFRWQLAQWTVATVTTTQKDQEERFAIAWGRLNLAGDNRRLLGAACYFHTACRLRRESKWPGEFLAESLLNFCKVLEVLYGGDRDSVRGSLSALGYSSQEIERDFIPVMLLRNSIDVGHPNRHDGL
jgi:hypothetical protein